MRAPRLTHQRITAWRQYGNGASPGFVGGFAPMVEATLEAVRKGAVASRPAAPAAEGGGGKAQRMIDLGFGRFPVPRVLVRGPGRA